MDCFTPQAGKAPPAESVLAPSPLPTRKRQRGTGDGDASALQEEIAMSRKAFARERMAKTGALRLASHLKSRNNRAKLRAEEAASKFDALSVRHARFMSRDHIVIGGKAMRLLVIPRSNESLGSADSTRDHYSTGPMDAEGHDLVGAEPAAQAPGPERPRKRKRRKVRCHQMLVSVFDGAVQARDGGGWEYTYDAFAPDCSIIVVSSRQALSDGNQSSPFFAVHGHHT
jgi:hypothetical protein